MEASVVAYCLGCLWLTFGLTGGLTTPSTIPVATPNTTNNQTLNASLDDVVKCDKDHFHCTDGKKCIPMRWHCDYVPDCYDGSDEPDNCPPRTCSTGQFHCATTSKCIPSGWVCDGEPDCGYGHAVQDTSDEDPRRCVKGSTCPKNYFLCKDNITCRPISKICDNNFDCPDWSDEGPFCTNQTFCSNIVCEYKCKPSLNGPLCFCGEGKEPNGTACVDTDECKIEGTCDQICLNTNGSHECSCTVGYTKDGSHCVAVNVPESKQATIIFSNAKDIQHVYLNGTSVLGDSLIKHPDTFAMEFDHRNSTVCWINYQGSHGSLKCSEIYNLSNPWSITPASPFQLGTASQLALDWVSGNWYFMDDEREIIFVCNHTLEVCITLIDVDLSKPRGIALDPTKGLMFYTEWGSTAPKLERARLDGSDRKNLVDYKIVYPYGVAVDYPNERVYWVDTYLDYIESVDYSGDRRLTVIRGAPVQNLYGITVFEQDLYVTSWREHSIVRVNKHNHSDFSTIKGNLSRPFAIHVFHRQRQPDVIHPCASNNGNCDHICITLWKSKKPFPLCRCKPGFRIVSSTKCAPAKQTQFLLFGKARPGMIKGITMMPGDKQIEVMVPITELMRPTAVDYDISTQFIYYSDVPRYVIERQKLDGSQREVVVDSGLNGCEGLAVDWMGKNLYWTDESLHSVFVAQIANVTRKKLLIHGNLTHPRSIVVHPKNGFLYWSDWSVGHNFGADPHYGGKIERAWMDGTNRQVLIGTKLQWPNGLTIDFVDKKLYFCDAYLHKIERVNLDGSSRELLLDGDGLEHPYSVAYFDDYIYWSEFQKGKIQRANLKTKLIETVRVENPPVFELRLFNNASQTGSNPCQEESNKCVDLCLAVPEPRHYVCACRDGYTVADDGFSCEPAVNYTDPTRCKDNEFRCLKNLRCIDRRFLCDGDNDCGDGSDEDSTPGGPCDKINCTDDNMQCDKNRCISIHWVCDGDRDCADGTDESPDKCKNNTCSAFQFTCKVTGRCIPMSWTCDLDNDCGEGDNSDEHASCEYPTCEEPEFQCNNKRCIPTEYVCDSDDDCRDNSDELNCPNSCTAPHQFQCVADHTCVPSSYRCNLIWECYDGSDEANCTGSDRNSTVKHCHEDEFQCADGNCVRKAWKCDLVHDCADGSDELGCVNVTCGPQQFMCHDRSRCIYRSFQCDGASDCADGSDELGCTAHSPSCLFPSYVCGNTTQCINITQVCDDKPDCKDGSDEGPGCTQFWCESGECSDLCRNTPDGFRCYCQAGRRLLDDRRTCSDAASCAEWGVCSQRCTQLKYSHKCECMSGYALEPDQFTCKSTDLAVPQVIFSNRHELRAVDLHTHSVKALISGLKNTIALDFYYGKESTMVFWTDVVDDKIYRGTMIGDSLTNIDVVVQTGLATAEGLAVDWIGENLYWVESNLDQIEVAKLNGSFRRTLIAGDMESPRAIALDPRYGIMFWTDWDSEAPRIESSSMSGEGRRTVLRVDNVTDGAWPNGLTLDYTLDRIYWIDAKSDSIHTAKYDGSDHREIIRANEWLTHPFAIAVFGNYVYWTDWRSNSVIGANKWNGSDHIVIQRTITQPFDIQILHPSRQPKDIKNPCGDTNGGCSHLCLLSFKSTYHCHCPHVMKLTNDNRTCVRNERVLLFSRNNEIRGVDLDKPYYHIIPPLNSPHVISASQIDFDAKERQFYWADSHLNEVKRSSLNGNLIETIIDTSIVHPSGFAIDWISRNMFIVSHDAKASSILACRLNGEYISRILDDHLFVPKSLAVDPFEGKLYWSEHSVSQHSIRQCNMDGSDIKTLTSQRDNEYLNSPESLTVDIEGRKLYWVNIESKNPIQYYDLVTLKVGNVALGHQQQPHSLTVYKDSMYFADHADKSIHIVDKLTGENDRLFRNTTSDVLALRVYDAALQNGTNACSSDNGGCSHLCLPRSRTECTCRCSIGYSVDQTNKKACVGAASFVLYSNEMGIRGLPLEPRSNASEVLAPISKVAHATSIDFVADEGYIYWVDSEIGNITRIHRDGTGREPVVGGLESIESLAIDWIAGNIYWTEPSFDVIEVARLNGSNRYVVVAGDLDKPMSIVVHPARGLLFWTDLGTTPKIERSALDGSARQVIVNSSIQFVTDMTIDYADSKLYWCDSRSESIERVDFDGANRVTVLHQQHLRPFAVSVLDGYIYWIGTVHKLGSLVRADKSNASIYSNLTNSIGDSAKDVLLFHSRKQLGSNPCAITNGGCQELCFYLGEGNITCACAHGRVAADRKSCEDYDVFIMFSRVSRIDSIHLTNETSPNAPFRSIHDAEYMRNVIGLAFDYSTRRVFYSDIQRGSINSVFFNGTNHTVVVEKQGSVEGLAYERLHQELYWTCNSDATINRIHLNVKNAKVEKIVKLGLDDKPRGIAVDSCDSRMYWTNWNSRHPSIQRSYLSGYELQSIITTDVRMPNALAIDHKAERLYWSDARFDKIERCNLDGSRRHVILTTQPQHPFDIAIYGQYIYWTDWVLHGVLRANKYNGEDVMWLRKNVPRPMGIIAVAKDADDCTLNPCHVLNGGCQDMCTSDENGTVSCSCHSGRILLPDAKRCAVKLANCSELEFECAVGVCIPYQLTCDGVTECPDGGDEELSYCASRVCRDQFYHCSNNRCIPKEKVCNENNDCMDNSDEHNCTCSESQFRCRSGMCISNEYKCDYDADCTDASDEMGCPLRDCERAPIDGARWMPLLGLINCKHTTACIHSDWICDGQNDCWDNSDEENCDSPTGGSGTTVSVPCPASMHRCGTGRCIPASWVCDKEQDCNDAGNGTTVTSDEINCNYTCAGDKFQCTDTVCIPKSWQCDGLADCPDGSDENAECLTRQCSEVEFRCNKTGRCIPLPWVCDGENDCADDEASDEHPEHGCSNQGCPDDSYQCLNLKCIYKGFYCDKDDDCGDNSDEPATCVHKQCPKGQFQCKTKQLCLSKSYVCNQQDDCGDGSDEDEVMCSVNATLDKCRPHEFECANSVCINETLLCNGENNCGDFSDEERCNINECYVGSACAQQCKDKVIGYECSCYDGFRLMPDKKSCKDIDECREHYPCSQYCHNTHGSYTCSCAAGYIARDNGTSCTLNSTSKPSLIFSNRYYIRQVDFSGQDTKLLAHNLTNAVALDYDFLDKCIYWSDVTALGSSLKRMCDGKPGHRVLHSATVQNPDGLAVDWIGRNLYWCDKGTDTIEVSKLDGQFRKVLVRDGLQEPRAIVLDPSEGNLYWTDWGERPYIARVGMDGSQRSVIVNDSLGWPNALTISYVTRELFWADAREDYVAVTDLNGNNRRVIVSRGDHHAVHHIFSLAVFEDYLFWTDWETKSVERCHKYSCKERLRIAGTVHRPMSIQVYHQDRQPQPAEGQNPCANNGGCRTLCLLQPGGKERTCACPENYYLGEDGTSCISNCTRTQFVCATTYRCIPFWWHCDTQDDCGDNSDEPDDCPPFKCTPGQFQCENHNCIHPSQICDGESQCTDHSDERNCDDYPCLSSQFKCSGNGSMAAKCIPASSRCDGHVDCPNREDEGDCPPRTCQPSQFTCNGTTKCIPNVWVCDTDDDCGDNSDELQTCTNRSCAANQLRCNSGRCIPLSWRCDGDHDCADGEDEPASCSDPATGNTCDPSYFKCANGRCIPGRWKCDYDDDCGDLSDESGCKPRNCSESEFRCRNGRCIRGTWRCNGEFNCEDQSDETACNMTCRENEFQCRKPEFCIYKEWKCDGDTDCADGSDEDNCQLPCKDGEHACGNGECISSMWLCDGDDDCDDGSDEDHDKCGEFPCRPDQFRCWHNNTCIDQERVCDGVRDCADGSDETTHKCPANPCRLPGLYQCANLRCVPREMHCDKFDDCGDNSDERDCEEEPCRFGTCSQVCVKKSKPNNRSGNITCSCAPGYLMERKKNKLQPCKSLGEQAYLLIGYENELRWLNPYQQSVPQDILPNYHTQTNKIHSIDVFYNNGRPVVYWTNYHSNSIMRYAVPLVNASSRSRRVKRQEAEIVITNLNKPRGVSIDWIAERIYWIDAGDATISFANLNGTQRTTVIRTQLDQPHDIAVDPESGKMFWTDWGFHAKIEVANLDGSERRTLVSDRVHWPTGIAIDYAARRVYWADTKAGTVETVTIEGKDRHVVRAFLAEKVDNPYKIEIFEDYLYVTTYHVNNVFKMNKFGHGNLTFLVRGFARPTDIVIVQEYKQNRNLTNLCRSDTCGAGAVCVVQSNGSACVCPDGLMAQNVTNTNKTKAPCVPKPPTAKPPVVCNLICLNSGTCVMNSDNDQSCKCKESYDGERCEHYRCSEYCKNRGFCYTDLLAPEVHGQKPPLKCSCPNEWTGDRCEIPADICKSFCKNNGNCTIQRGGAGARCSCQPGLTGVHCESCIGFECKNGGHCLQSSEGNAVRSKCVCPLGFNGTHCEHSLCDGGYCHEGKCSLNAQGTPTCTCFPGYEGKRCETDRCEGLCNNGGTCRRTSAKIRCDCMEGYTGNRCESNRCGCKNGSCIKSKNGQDFLCSCLAGFTGPQCDKMIDFCDANTCRNFGTCSMVEGKPYCQCVPEWTGSYCENSANSNACTGFCVHGTCSITANFKQIPRCQCKPGWAGTRCDQRSECYLFCFNGGTCLPALPDSDVKPACICPYGVQGLRCETLSSPTKGTSSISTGVAGTIIAVVVVALLLIISAVTTVAVCRRRKRGKPFMHKRMQDSSNVEINNPMYMRGEVEDDAAEPMEPAFTIDPDKVTNFSNPVYETLYTDGATGASSEEKKGLLQGDNLKVEYYDGHARDPLTNTDRETYA